MSKSFTTLVSSLVMITIGLAPLAFGASSAQAHSDQDALRLAVGSPYLYPGNVVCKDFDKTGFKTWRSRTDARMDLGNWDGSFLIHGAIEPGAFVSKGVDLYDVLESRCGLHARAEQGRRTRTW